MAKKEVKTDLWVARQLDDSKIKYDPQGSDVKEINDALQSASKRGTGNAGYPEYVADVYKRQHIQHTPVCDCCFWGYVKIDKAKVFLNWVQKTKPLQKGLS